MHPFRGSESRSEEEQKDDAESNEKSVGVDQDTSIWKDANEEAPDRNEMFKHFDRVIDRLIRLQIFPGTQQFQESVDAMLPDDDWDSFWRHVHARFRGAQESNLSWEYDPHWHVKEAAQDQFNEVGARTNPSGRARRRCKISTRNLQPHRSIRGLGY